MPNENVWIFLSYAHDDDLPTGDSEDEEGFVTYLHRKLETKLRELGASQAKLWRDHKRFSNGDPYNVEIEDALKKSALLMVVMSKNWLSRPYCRKELNEFIRMRQASGIANVDERMVVVGKRFVPKVDRPAPLNLQVGFDFFQSDDQDDVLPEKEFFNLGKPLDDARYFQVRDELAKHLQKRVERIAMGAGTGTTLPADVKIATDNGRTVYPN